MHSRFPVSHPGHKCIAMYSRFPVHCAEAMCLLLLMHMVLLVPQWIVHLDLKSTYCFYAYMHEIMNLNHSKSACTIHWAIPELLVGVDKGSEWILSVARHRDPLADPVGILRNAETC